VKKIFKPIYDGKLPRPYDEGNMAPSMTGDKRDLVIIEQDVLKEVIDVASTSITYCCKAICGADLGSPVWQVCRISKSGNVTTIEWADGDGKYDNIATNRASLTYK
jgi:hypothetical protein